MVSPALSTLLDAAPVNAAVMVPAVKLPLASRATMADAVLAFSGSSGAVAYLAASGDGGQLGVNDCGRCVDVCVQDGPIEDHRARVIGDEGAIREALDAVAGG
jgi:hypothetical protein